MAFIDFTVSNFCFSIAIASRLSTHARACNLVLMAFFWSWSNRKRPSMADAVIVWNTCRLFLIEPKTVSVFVKKTILESLKKIRVFAFRNSPLTRKINQPGVDQRQNKIFLQAQVSALCVGTTDNNSMARKVVSKTVIVAVHLDIIIILKKITNPETSFGSGWWFCKY